MVIVEPFRAETVIFDAPTSDSGPLVPFRDITLASDDCDVRYALAFRDIPELLTVQVTLEPAEFSPTKLVFALEAIAVVR